MVRAFAMGSSGPRWGLNAAMLFASPSLAALAVLVVAESAFTVGTWLARSGCAWFAALRPRAEMLTKSSTVSERLAMLLTGDLASGTFLPAPMRPEMAEMIDDMDSMIAWKYKTF